jgi:cytoskeleton protein RodZ
MTDPLATPGPRLKAERERRGMSLQKAADELHLDAWVIGALETEDYARVGPQVYAKGHLKRYAALLGLPAAEIMAGYESRAQAPMPAATQSAVVRLRTDDEDSDSARWPQILGSIAVGLLLLGVLWWRPWHHRAAAPVAGAAVAANPNATASESAADTTAAAGLAAGEPPSTAQSPSPTPSPSMPPKPSAQLAPPDADAASTSPGAALAGDAAAGSGKARLRLSFSADSWVDVHDAAGRLSYAGNGRANSVKTIAGIAPMRVYLGFASGVQLEINNRAVAIGPQFMAGDVARFEAGADGVLRRDSHSATPPSTAPRNARPIG